eukprot:CAMPEP_0177651276 /NCGR_PEP_ID=MMETSP0447-20121125/12451_1 /TAXON_ID=0 /ORGANISM="Stygamoeba regulata, Strain BSH-02190019" /LENGTH=285 /DNA_ID=CAMNT_0019154325 /DNA_START=290 /DNA_END=1144 /DNA_ORIENTATION=+
MRSSLLANGDSLSPLGTLLDELVCAEVSPKSSSSPSASPSFSSSFSSSSACIGHAFEAFTALRASSSVQLLRKQRACLLYVRNRLDRDSSVPLAMDACLLAGVRALDDGRHAAVGCSVQHEAAPRFSDCVRVQVHAAGYVVCSPAHLDASTSSPSVVTSSEGRAGEPGEPGEQHVSVAPAADRTTEAVLRFAMRVDLPPHTELSEQQFSQLVHEQAARLARFRALLCGEHIPASSVASTDVNPVDLLREKANSDNDHDGDREVEHDVGCDDDDEAAAATATAATA